MGLAYIQLVRYMPFMDAEFDGKLRACQMDVLQEFGPMICKETGHTALLFNGDLTAKEADELVKQGKIDAAVFGRPFINNPEYVFTTVQTKPSDTHHSTSAIRTDCSRAYQ